MTARDPRALAKLLTEDLPIADASEELRSAITGRYEEVLAHLLRALDEHEHEVMYALGYGNYCYRLMDGSLARGYSRQRLHEVQM